MFHRTALTLMTFVVTGSVQAAGPFTAKTLEAKPPAELNKAIGDLLASTAVQVFDGKEQLYCEIWFRKAIPSKSDAGAALTYRSIEDTTLLGVIRFAQKVKEYREQEVPPGVYTLRLGFQPQDGDHMGSSPHPEFCLLSSTKLDEKPETMFAKDLNRQSSKSIGTSHPGVLLLFPVGKPLEQPEMKDQGNNHWVLRHTVQIDVKGKATPIGIVLNVHGHSAG
jgi:hypothetical protein